MTLPPNQKLAAPGRWPQIGEKAPRAGDSSPWSLTVCGLVEQPLHFSLDELLLLPMIERAIDIHCVTRWSLLQVPFAGVPLGELLLRAVPKPEARFVSFIARSDRSHSTTLTLADAIEQGVLLATHCEGAPLPIERGGPLRSVCPGRYFYKSVKWLERIELLAEDRPGYWESVAGYHNGADPLLEQRYAASSIAPGVLEAALAARDFSGLDLRGADLRGYHLEGLVARGALLRDVHFEGARLQRADFTGANLSNAHFDGADCTGVRFTGADLEGAAFEQALLGSADFTDAALMGATFDEGAGPIHREER